MVTNENVISMIEHFKWFHRHPETALCEFKTTERIREILSSIEGVEILELGLPTGVLARIVGGEGPSVALRADIDALPVNEESGLDYSSEQTGRMHACGHDFHTTALLGAAGLIAAERRKLRGSVYLLFQPAEEAERGGAKVVDTGLFEKYPISAIYALHTKPNIPVGTILISEGPFSAAVDRFKITITGRGCHASAPQDGLDPIPAAARLVGALQEIVSRGVHPLESAVVSVTRFNAGNTWNVIPDTAELEGTVRTYKKDVREFTFRRMDAYAEALRIQGYHVKTEYIWGCPATDNDAAAAQLIRETARELGIAIQEQIAGMGGEDFSCFQEIIPGALFHIGTGPSAPLHNSKFKVDVSALKIAAELFAGIVTKALSDQRR